MSAQPSASASSVTAGASASAAAVHVGLRVVRKRWVSLWVKGAIFLLGLNGLSLLIGRSPWLWDVPDEFYNSIDFVWAEAHQLCHRLQAVESASSARPLVLIVGSSFVIYDIDEHLVTKKLSQADGQDPEIVKLGMGGACATDIERIARALGKRRSGLLIYLTAPRDYPRRSEFDPRSTPLATVVQPTDRWLPDWRGRDPNEFLDDLLSRYFALYRYRTFVRMRLAWEARWLASSMGVRALRLRQRAQPPEDVDLKMSFAQFRGKEPASLELYLLWLNTVKEYPDRYLASQKAITSVGYGLTKNEQVVALKRMLRAAVRTGLRPILIHPPVNPLIRNGSTPYYDRPLADAYTTLFERLSAGVGGAAWDWRVFGELDQFADFNHLNGHGRQAFSLRLAEFVQGQLAGLDGPTRTTTDAAERSNG
jgi:hypothetical protein